MTLALALALAKPSMERYEFTQAHMGMAVRVVLYSSAQEVAESAARAAFARFADLDTMFSDYRADSTLNRMLAAADGTPQSAPAEMVDILGTARRLSALTEGAFDVTAAPLVRLWREARKTSTIGSAEELAAARALVGYRRVFADQQAKTVSIEPGTRIDLGGIAKGYACDQAIQAIRSKGVTSALVEAGGDIAVSGPPPGREGWTISLEHVGQGTVNVVDCAVSTSGDTEQFVEIDGVRYSHVIDPRTGLGTTERVQATVIANRGELSDPLATAICVLGTGSAERIARQFGVRCWALSRR
ncbi:MAG: FAD:protein FMN transferase [Fimbriimonadaceae bacterium]